MNVLRIILISVGILTCLMLIGVILLQQAKGGGGLGTAFGGGMGETIFGSRAGNILTKATITLAIIFLANTTLLGITYSSKEEGSLVDSAAVPSAPQQQVPAPVTGGQQVPPPTQQGTLFTGDDDVPAPVQQTAPIQDVPEVEPFSLAPEAPESAVPEEQTTAPAAP